LLPGELANSCQILKNFPRNTMIPGCHLDVLKDRCTWCMHWWLAIFVQVPSSCISRIVIGRGTQQTQILYVLCTLTSQPLSMKVWAGVIMTITKLIFSCSALGNSYKLPQSCTCSYSVFISCNHDKFQFALFIFQCSRLWFGSTFFFEFQSCHNTKITYKTIISASSPNNRPSTDFIVSRSKPC
jgi:hypothetical protein